MKNKKKVKLTAKEYKELWEIDSKVNIYHIKREIYRLEDELRWNNEYLSKNIDNEKYLDDTDLIWNLIMLKILHNVREVYRQMYNYRYEIMNKNSMAEYEDLDQKWWEFRDLKKVLENFNLKEILKEYEIHKKEYPDTFLDKFRKIKYGFYKTKSLW